MATAKPPKPPRQSRADAAQWKGLALLTRIGLLALITLAVLAVVAAGLLRTEQGSTLLLRALPGVQVLAARGALWGDFSASRIEIDLPDDQGGDGDHITLVEPSWRGLRIGLLPMGPPWLRLRLDKLTAQSVEYTTAPAKDSNAIPSPLQAPTDLRLPIALRINELRIGTLRATSLGPTPVQDLQASVQLDSGVRGEHVIEQIALRYGDFLGSGSLRATVVAPIVLSAAVDLKPSVAAPSSSEDAFRDWTAHIELHGPVARPLATAELRARGQSLDAKATLQPFEKWPLAELDARVQTLNLAALLPGAPTTSLSGSAHATAIGQAQPVGVDVALTNDAAGRWDESRLPVKSLHLRAQAQPADASTVELHAFDAELGTRTQSAGRLAGSGEWRDGQWKLDSALDAVQPQLLDGRMAGMTLNGPLLLTGSGFGTASPGAAPQEPTVSVHSELNGRVRLPGAGSARRTPDRAVSLRADATLSPSAVDLRSFEASSGGARAAMSGRADRRDAQAPWVIAAKLAFSRFDPTPWWPGPAGSPWRQGTHRLNAEANANLTLAMPASPASAASDEASRDARSPRRQAQPSSSASPLAFLSRLHGDIDATIAPSVLAGVPLSGKLQADRPAGASDWSAKLDIDAAGNTAHAAGHLAMRGSGEDDRWDVSVKAPSLDPLAPLVNLFNDRPPEALNGALEASATLQGRWPLLGTSGNVDVPSLRSGSTTVKGARMRWRLGTAVIAPLDLQVHVAQAQSGTHRVSDVELSLQGTAGLHTLEAGALVQALPPAWVDTLRANRPSAGGAAVQRATRIALKADGGALREKDARGATIDTSAPTGWKGTLRQFDVSDTTGPNAPWIHVDPVEIDARLAGPDPRVSLSASKADLIGASLRWTRLLWQGGSNTSLDGQLQLDPLSVGPILARLQPEFGWSGDLQIAARLQTQGSGPQARASFELFRVGGDLRVNDDPKPGRDEPAQGALALGLSELRLSATSQGGNWRFTQALTSSSFGSVQGTQTARTEPGSPWPSADAPLSGDLSARLSNLSSLSPWIPSGWRVGGQLNAQARIGGRVGAPEYTGTVNGQALTVRNVLQGVNITDGDLRVALQGTSARVERFVAKSGKGEARVTGGATFGSSPTAQLQLTADHFEVLSRVDRRIIVSGNAALRMDAKRIDMEGAFKLDEGLIDFTRSDAPSLDSDVEVVRTAGVASAPVEAPAQPAMARNVTMDIRLDLGDKLRIKGRGIDTGLGGDMRIISSDGRLTGSGTLGTIGGTYKAYGQNLAIDRGLIIFNGPLDNPRLDIEATRPDIDTRVGVQVTGTALNPRVRLFSDAAMTDIDRISWLMLGRAPDTVGGADAALLQRAALGLLAGDKGGGGTNSLVKSLGLDDISLGQTGTGDAKQTVVTLGKQISKRLYVGFERGINGTAGGWQLIYRIAQRFTVRATTGTDSSVDVIWVWRWN